MENENKLVSIVIPIYNAEKYLRRCLDSTLTQTYSNIEVVCVNDGSTDNSLNILKDYQSKDSRIKIIDKENAGVSAARNDGIRQSKGDYIIFIDADDWIEKNTVEVSLEYTIKYNAEHVRYAYVQEFNDSKRRKEYGKIYDKPTLVEKKSFASDIVDKFIGSYEYNSIWMFMTKRSFLIENNILFDESTFYAEDFLFTMNIYEHLQSAVYLPYTFYHYINNMNSITTKVSVEHVKNKIQNSIQNYSKLYQFCEYFNCLNDERKKKIKQRIKGEVELCIRTIYPAQKLLRKEERLSIIQFAIDECKKNDLTLNINSKNRFDFENLLKYRYLNGVKKVIKRIIYK